MTSPPECKETALRVRQDGFSKVNGEKIRPQPLTSPKSETQARAPLPVNSAWRVAVDPLQWILQHREGERWRDRSFCVTREGLLRCIRQHCGPADLSAVAALPDWHPDRQGPKPRTSLLGASLPAEGAI